MQASERSAQSREELFVRWSTIFAKVLFRRIAKRNTSVKAIGYVKKREDADSGERLLLVDWFVWSQLGSDARNYCNVIVKVFLATP